MTASLSYLIGMTVGTAVGAHHGNGFNDCPSSLSHTLPYLDLPDIWIFSLKVCQLLKIRCKISCYPHAYFSAEGAYVFICSQYGFMTLQIAKNYCICWVSITGHVAICSSGRDHADSGRTDSLTYKRRFSLASG